MICSNTPIATIGNITCQSSKHIYAQKLNGCVKHAYGKTERERDQVLSLKKHPKYSWFYHLHSKHLQSANTQITWVLALIILFNNLQLYYLKTWCSSAKCKIFRKIRALHLVLGGPGRLIVKKWLTVTNHHVIALDIHSYNWSLSALWSTASSSIYRELWWDSCKMCEVNNPITLWTHMQEGGRNLFISIYRIIIS